MEQSKSSLSSVVKKPRSYVMDMDALKAEINEEEVATTKITTPSSNEKKAEPKPKNENKSKLTASSKKKSKAPLSSVTPTPPALHIPVTIEMRDSLKIAAITEGIPMKDLVVKLIADYLDATTNR